MLQIIYRYGTWNEYQSLATKDPNTLYFITDGEGKGSIYKGDTLYGAARVEFVETLPEFADAKTGVMYVVVKAGSSPLIYVKGDTKMDVVAGGDAMIVVADEAEMLALTDIRAGQQVHREDTRTTWIFKGGEIANISNWTESSNTIWSGTTTSIVFKSVTKAEYEAIEAYDANTLYFVTDSGKIYKGNTDVTKSVVAVTDDTVPAVDDAVIGMLYFNTTTFEIKTTFNNVDWAVLSPGYLIAGTDWETADGSKFATIGLIKEAMAAAIDALSFDVEFDATTGKVSVGDGEAKELTGVAHDASYDSANLKITIPMYGKDPLVINIPKDKFVTAGQYHETYTDAEGTTHEGVIVLTIETQETPVIIPAKALVDVYTADNSNVQGVEISITDDNKVSAKVVLSADAKNAITLDANGALIVDITGKVDKITGAVGGKVIISNADGNVKETGFSIKAAGDDANATMGESDAELPTAKLIAAAISAAIKTLSDTVTDALGKKVDKVEGAVENDVATFTAGGNVKDSGVKIGGAKLSEAPSDKTVATEAAILDALSWKPISE